MQEFEEAARALLPRLRASSSPAQQMAAASLRVWLAVKTAPPFARSEEKALSASLEVEAQAAERVVAEAHEALREAADLFLPIEDVQETSAERLEEKALLFAWLANRVSAAAPQLATLPVLRLAEASAGRDSRESCVSQLSLEPSLKSRLLADAVAFSSASLRRASESSAAKTKSSLLERNLRRLAGASLVRDGCLQKALREVQTMEASQKDADGAAQILFGVLRKSLQARVAARRVSEASSSASAFLLPPSLATPPLRVGQDEEVWKAQLAEHEALKTSADAAVAEEAALGRFCKKEGEESADCAGLNASAAELAASFAAEEARGLRLTSLAFLTPSLKACAFRVLARVALGASLHWGVAAAAGEVRLSLTRLSTRASDASASWLIEGTLLLALCAVAHGGV